MESTAEPLGQRLKSLALLCAKMGCVAFGGPAAHVAMLEDEVVARRGWMERGHFLDLLGATNLIPGPNSTEMVMHVGFARAGWLGLAVAGACFITPAALMTGVLAWAYVEFGALPSAEAILSIVQPVALAVILAALYRLGKKAIAGLPSALIAAVVVLVAGAGLLGEVASLLVGGAVGGGALYLLRRRDQPPSPPEPKSARQSRGGPKRSLWLLVGGALPSATLAAPGLLSIFWTFLVMGSVLYGSGYVLVAYLDGALVQDFGWLTRSQLLDAIAAGQLTPGPVLTTATFVGYVLAGVPGAVVATLGIFLPAFFAAGLLHPWVAVVRRYAFTAALLDAVNAAALALMGVVSVRLGLSAAGDPVALLAFLGAAVLVFRWRVSVPVLMLLAVALGLARHAMGL